MRDWAEFGEAFVCPCCQREVERTGHGWMVGEDICKECFYEWYDGDRPTAGQDENNAYLIGMQVRKRAGLRRLSLATWEKKRGGASAPPISTVGSQG